MDSLKDVLPEQLPVDQLFFDTTNPRLPSNLDKGNESEIIRWMLNDASLIELMGSIGEQGYFQGEPLLGVREKKHVVIVEGNRRLASVKLLNNPDLAPNKKNAVTKVVSEAKIIPKVLPVIIYPTREEIISYLGYRHVTGIKPWEPLAKARYLRELFNIEKGTDDQRKYRSLAKKIGSRSDYVARLLTGFALFQKIEENDFFGIDELDEETIDFSILTTAINYASISTYIGINTPTDPSLKGLKTDELSDLINWLFTKNREGQTRIGESRNLSLLSKIIPNEKAFKVWKDGAPLDYAITFTEAPGEIFNKSVLDSYASLRTARDYSHLITKTESGSLDVLEDIKKLAQDLYTILLDRTR